MDAKKIGKKIEENKTHLKQIYHIKEIGVFGSFIRGEETVSSDIDILVEFEKGHNDLFNYIRLKYYLEGLLGRKVDLVKKNAVKSRLKERIFSEVKYVQV